MIKYIIKKMIDTHGDALLNTLYIFLYILTFTLID